MCLLRRAFYIFKGFLQLNNVKVVEADQQHIGKPDNGIERISQVVGNNRKELVLCSIKLIELLVLF